MDRFLAFLYKLIPKFGLLRVLQFKSPTPLTENLFEASFNATPNDTGICWRRNPRAVCISQTTILILGNKPGRESTGSAMKPMPLLHNLALQKFQSAPPRLCKSLLEYFSSPDAPYAMKNNPKAWAQLQEDLAALKSRSESNGFDVTGEGSR